MAPALTVSLTDLGGGLQELALTGPTGSSILLDGHPTTSAAFAFQVTLEPRTQQTFLVFCPVGPRFLISSLPENRRQRTSVRCPREGDGHDDPDLVEDPVWPAADPPG
jgi:hypothetical protein